MHQVAITGIGIVSVLGTGAARVSESLQAGRCGVAVDPERAALGFRGPLTGVISDFTPPPVDKKQKRTLTAFGLQAVAAALEAIQMAGWSKDETASERTGLIIGNDSSALANIEQAAITAHEKSTFPIGASMVFQALNSTVTMNLGAILGTRGASWTLSGACASGGHSIGQAADLIALGRQDRVLAGGVQEINWQSICSFDATNAFSTKVDDPARALRPFDEARDGLVPSGGAAIVALENAEQARRRGAPILGYVRAYAFSSDGANLAAPTGEGLQRAMAECLARGGAAPQEVDYVCAHATSTPLGDAAEARAIAATFGSARPWVSSTKGMTGHEMWMAGAAQVVYAMLMGRDGFIAPNVNFTAQEEGAAPLRIAAETIAKRPRTILCNSAGFGGTNSCLLLETAS